MSSLHVCPLSRLSQVVAASEASHLATLINAGTSVERPASIREEHHLFLGFNDIVEPTEGLIAIGAPHLLRFFDFVDGWDRVRPMVIHCWAGISRSTAGAYVAACRLMPDRSERDIARELRARAPSATPNLRLVRLADQLMQREGRMAAAIEAIGRGADAWEGAPFELPILSGEAGR